MGAGVVFYRGKGETPGNPRTRRENPGLWFKISGDSAGGQDNLDRRNGNLLALWTDPEDL